MKTFLKIVAGLVVLLVISVAVFLYTFDAENYKQEITVLAESATGRPISIEGELDISLYPWIGIKVSGVTVGNTPGFSNQVFATIGQLDVQIKIVPLLQKRLDVEKLVLHAPTVDFEVNAAGENNWSDITGTTQSSAAESKFGLAGLAIGSIDLKDARFTWLDANSGRQFKISKMSLGTQAIEKGQPLPIEFKARVESSQPEWVAAISAKTELVLNRDSAVFDAKGIKLSAKALLPGTEIGKLSLAMVADSTIDLKTQTAKLNNAKLGMLGMVLAGTFDVENLFSVPVIQGPVKVKKFEAGKLAKHLKIDMPQLASAQSLKNIALTAKFKTDFDSVQLDNISASVDQSKLTGFVHVTGLSQPVIRYELKADTINLDDYRPVKAGPDRNEPALPLAFIRAAELDGVLEVETAAVGDLEVNQLQITSAIENGVVKANPIVMRVHGGEVSAALQFDAHDTPALLLTAEIRQVDAKSTINPLLNNIIGDEAPVLDGWVNADVNLSAKGFSMPALRTSAQGTIRFNMTKGTIKGIDFNYASQSVVIDYAQRNDFRVSRTFNDEYVPDSVTQFNSLSATFKVSKGKLVNDDLLMISEPVNVTGSGSIDFVNGKLDYRPVIDMNVKNTGNIRDKLRDHPMRYLAYGSLGTLTCEFDTERYDLHMGRLMIQEAKANRNRYLNSQSRSKWQNALSK